MPHADPDERRAYLRRRYHANPDLQRIPHARWKETKQGKETLRSSRGAQKAQKCGDKCDVAPAVYRALRALPCVTCGRTPAGGVDHILAFAHGGHNVEENLQAMCIDCNRLKGPRGKGARLA